MYPVLTSALVAGDVVELASCRRHLHTQLDKETKETLQTQTSKLFRRLGLDLA